MANSEKLLVQRAQKGERTALMQLYQEYYDTIYTYIYFRVQNEVIAQDLTAEVFVRMVTHIQSFSYRQQVLLAWLYTIARNLVTDHFRANGREAFVPLSDELMENGRTPDELAHLQMTQQQLAVALDNLTDEQRQVILLRFVEGYRLQEVAQRLGKTEGAIKALQHRALGALRRTLVKEFGYETA